MSIGQTNELARLRSQTIWQMLSRVTQRNPQRNALVAANDAGEVQHLCYGRLMRSSIWHLYSATRRSCSRRWA